MFDLLAAPFLPPGRGGLILIMGGLSMLAGALFLLMLAPGRIPAGARLASGSVGRAVARAERGEEDAPAVLSAWQRALCARAAEGGLGGLKVRDAEDLSCVIVLDACPSCCRGRRACRRERRTLLRAARRITRAARVDEIACRIRARPCCAFVVDMAGP